MAFPRCCRHCQDYKYCDDRGGCCEFCDYYVNSKCAHKMFKGKLMMGEIEPDLTIADYRGDDYGIDDYNEYEELN